MADIQQDLIIELRELVTVLSAQSNIGVGGKDKFSVNERAERIRNKKNEKVENEILKNIKDFKDTSTKNLKDIKNIRNLLDRQSKLSENLVKYAKNSMTEAQMDDFLVELKNQAGKINTRTTKQMMSGIKTFDDAVKLHEKILKRSENINQFGVISKELKELKKQGVPANHKKYQFLMKKIEELGFTTKDVNRNFTQLTKETYGLVNAFGDAASREIPGGIYQMKNAFSKFSKFMGGLSLIAKPLIDMVKGLLEVESAAAKYGTIISNQQLIKDARLMGMTQQELIEVQAKHKQTIGSMNLSYDQYNNLISKNQSELLLYTGSLKEANQMNAELFTIQKRLGSSNQDSAKFITQQTKSFKRFNSVFSMTSDEFVNMQKQLIDSSNVQGGMLMMDIKRRALHQQEMTNTIEKLKIDGLMQDQAMKVIDTFKQIGLMNPKDRWKKAAQLQAAGGALGVGREASELAMLQRRRFSQAGDMERAAELSKVMQGALTQAYEKGGPSADFFLHRLTDGLGDVFGPSGIGGMMELQKGQGLSNERVSELMTIANKKNDTFYTDVITELRTLNNIVGASGDITNVMGNVKSLFTGLLDGGVLSAIVGSAIGVKAGRMLGGVGGKISQGVGKVKEVGATAGSNIKNSSIPKRVGVGGGLALTMGGHFLKSGAEEGSLRQGSGILASIIGEMATGAGLGSVVAPGIGTAIGAIGGAVTGIVTNFDDMKSYFGIGNKETLTQQLSKVEDSNKEISKNDEEQNTIFNEMLKKLSMAELNNQKIIENLQKMVDLNEKIATNTEEDTKKSPPQYVRKVKN